MTRCSTPSPSSPGRRRPDDRPGYPPVRRAGAARGMPSGDRLRSRALAAGHGPDGHLPPARPGRARRPPDRRGPARVLLQHRRRGGLPDQPAARGVRWPPGRPGGLPVDTRPLPAHLAGRARRRYRGRSAAGRSRSRGPGCWPGACSTRSIISTGACSSTGCRMASGARRCGPSAASRGRPGRTARAVPVVFVVPAEPGAADLPEFSEQAAQPLEGRLGRVVVAQYAKLVEQPVTGAVRVAQGE